MFSKFPNRNNYKKIKNFTSKNCVRATCVRVLCHIKLMFLLKQICCILSVFITCGSKIIEEKEFFYITFLITSNRPIIS